MSNGIEILIPRGFGGKDGLQALQEIHERKEVPKPKQKAKGKEAIEILSGDLGKEVFAELWRKYKDWTAMEGISCDSNSGTILGSNSFYVVAVNEILKEKGYRVANHLEVELAFQKKKIPAEHAYHTALVFRSRHNPNSNFARDISLQLAEKKIMLWENQAYVIPLWTLNLKKITPASRKMSFQITDETIYKHFEISILMKEGYFKNSDVNLEIGLPLTICQQSMPGGRYLSTTGDGLCALFMDNGDLIASSRKLDKTVPEGRTVIVKYERDPFWRKRT